MLAGPNVEQTKILSDKTGIDIIASGGMSCMDDLTHINDAGIHGAIIGKAIYEKRIDLKEAVNLLNLEHLTARHQQCLRLIFRLRI